eukprot:PhF_6_TR5026/c0_g1_i1/m.7091
MSSVTTSTDRASSESIEFSPEPDHPPLIEDSPNEVQLVEPMVAEAEPEKKDDVAGVRDLAAEPTPAEVGSPTRIPEINYVGSPLGEGIPERSNSSSTTRISKESEQPSSSASEEERDEVRPPTPPRSQTTRRAKVTIATPTRSEDRHHQAKLNTKEAESSYSSSSP